MKTKLEGTVVGTKRTQLTDEIIKISRNLVENEMKTVQKKRACNCVEAGE